MILSGIEIIKNHTTHNGLRIIPFSNKNVNPNSYDLTLSDDIAWYTPTDGILDMKVDNLMVHSKIPEEGFVLRPDHIYLARTNERTITNGFVPMLEGRSSVGRLGINIHSTAGFGDIGFDGYWTLELSCVQPVRIYANVRICQIYYHVISDDYVPYKGKYQKNKGIQSSQLWRDFENE